VWGGGGVGGLVAPGGVGEGGDRGAEGERGADGRGMPGSPTLLLQLVVIGGSCTAARQLCAQQC
jgi:hypothetical protein